MEKHVYFVRHGETDSNADRVLRGESSILNEKGKKQAEIVAERIAKIGVEALVSSSFPRAIDTARFISQKTGLENEQHGILGEWKHSTAVHGRHRDDPEVKSIIDSWYLNHADHHFKHSDEESFADLVKRAHEVVSLIEKHPAKRLCVVTHGAFLRVIAGVFIFGETFTKSQFISFMRHTHVHNTGITHIAYDPKDYGWKLISWNDSAHLG